MYCKHRTKEVVTQERRVAIQTRCSARKYDNVSVCTDVGMPLGYRRGGKILHFKYVVFFLFFPLFSIVFLKLSRVTCYYIGCVYSV